MVDRFGARRFGTDAEPGSVGPRLGARLGHRADPVGPVLQIYGELLEPLCHRGRGGEQLCAYSAPSRHRAGPQRRTFQNPASATKDFRCFILAGNVRTECSPHHTEETKDIFENHSFFLKAHPLGCGGGTNALLYPIWAFLHLFCFPAPIKSFCSAEDKMSSLWREPK